MKNRKKKTVHRRNFFKTLTAGGIGAILIPESVKAASFPIKQENEKPKTNIGDAKKYPRNEHSMPGKYPAKVVRVDHDKCVIDDKLQADAAYEMLEKGMLELTGSKNLKKAWKQFVGPKDIIGLKVNPVAGKTLTTSHEVVQAVISQLEDAGIPRKNILIWDRREFQLHETDYTGENYPGIKIIGTEQKDEDGSFYGKDGKLYGEKMIDKDWYYWADVNGEYDEYTIPYMVNGGKYSYYSKIATQMVDKIINIPILKNAGSSVTLCMKNIAYGVVSNTSRLHKNLWAETTAEVCAFPPVRDKVVLNIVDGLKGCFNGGPGANPQFFTNYKTMLLGTDAVAVDRVGYDIVVQKRIDEGLQTEESAKGRNFLKLAAALELGEAEIEKIDLNKFELS